MKLAQYSWQYTHQSNAYPVAHAFISGNRQFDNHTHLLRKLRHIQQVECNNHLRGGIFNVDSLADTSWMLAAIKMGYRYAVIWMEGCYPATHDFNLEILSTIDKYNEQYTWFIAGDYNEDAFKERIVIINLHAWHDKVNQPNPYISGVDINTASFGAGWIQSNDSYGYDIPALDESLMEMVDAIEPSKDLHQLDLGLSGKEYNNDNLNFTANRVINKLLQPSSPIFFVNTENSTPKVVSQLEDVYFEQYVGASAGFKLLYYAYKYGCDPAITKFVWYDFDPMSCKFKRDTLEQWDGENYTAWVDDWCASHPQADDSLKHMVAERWPIVVDQFGGQASWLEFWKNVQQSQWQVVECDLINNHSSLFDVLENVQTFLWTSNIYSYILPVLLSDPLHLESSFISLIKNLKSLDQHSWFSGTDINDNDIMCPVGAILSSSDNNINGFE